jgi:hypothetical protein
MSAACPEASRYARIRAAVCGLNASASRWPLHLADRIPRGVAVADQVLVEIHQPGRVAGIRRGLDHAERGDVIGEDAAQLAVEIGLARPERRYGRGDRRAEQLSSGPLIATRTVSMREPS